MNAGRLRYCKNAGQSGKHFKMAAREIGSRQLLHLSQSAAVAINGGAHDAINLAFEQIKEKLADWSK
jgi:hypothetical protein